MLGGYVGGGVEGTTGTASFGGEDGGVEESQGCGVLGISMACGVGMGCAAVISDVSGSTGLCGSGIGWDCVSIVRITDLPLDRVSEENHELG